MNKLAFALLTCSLAATAAAADLPGKSGVTVSAGTLGVGIEYSHTLPLVNLTGRLAWNGLSYDYDTSIEGIDYDLDLDLGTVAALLDWRPWGTFTHFTAGIVFNGNEIGANGRSNGSYTIGEQTFDAALVGNLTGTAGFDDVVPYFGLGWNLPIAPKTALSLDLGVMLHGEPTLTLTADGPIAADPLFQQELENERQQFEDDISDYEFYPVVSLGIRRRF